MADIPELDAQSVTWLIAHIGAVNWGLQETADINLAVELLGTGNVGIAYMVIGIAGVLSLTEWFDITDFFGQNGGN